MTMPDALLLLGRDHCGYGSVHVESSADGIYGAGKSAAAISVGSDPTSPSLAHKGDGEVCPNEDALLLIDDGRCALMAVTDAHHGEEAGHRLLELLAAVIERRGIPGGVPDLFSRIFELDYPTPARQPDSATTLLVATLERDRGKGAVISFGDSTLAWVGESGERRINVKIPRFVTLDRPGTLQPGWAYTTKFVVEPGGLLLAFTDGVDECHYGAPRTSVRGRHRAELFREVGPDPRTYVERLAQLALEGVRGRPGGQDNVAIVAATTDYVPG